MAIFSIAQLKSELKNYTLLAIQEIARELDDTIDTTNLIIISL